MVGTGLAATKGAKAIKLGDKTKKAATLTGKGVKIGGGWAIGTTAIETPEENLFNYLATEHGDYNIVGNLKVNDLIGKLKIDPNDKKSAQYLKAFMNNLLLEGILPTALIGGAKGTKAASKWIGDLDVSKAVGRTVANYSDYVVPTSLKDVYRTASSRSKEWMTSRLGVNDNAINMLMERIGGFKSNLTRASFYAESLQRSLKKELKDKNLDPEDSDYLENTVNAALAGDKTVDQAGLTALERLTRDA